MGHVILVPSVMIFKRDWHVFCGNARRPTVLAKFFSFSLLCSPENVVHEDILLDGLGLVCHFWIRNYSKMQWLKEQVIIDCVPKGWLELADLSSPVWEAQLGFLGLLQVQRGQLCPTLPSSSLEKQEGQGRLVLGRRSIKRASPVVREHIKFLPTYQPNQVTCRNQKSGRKHTLCAVRPKQVTWPSPTLVEQGDVFL